MSGSYMLLQESDIETKLKNYLEVPGPLPTPCWVWQGAKDDKGYGMIRNDGRLVRTHRASYMLHNGVIPAGKQINHHCNNPSCINPLHIYCGTAKQNIGDAIRAGTHKSNHPGASGFWGVQRMHNRWRALIRIGRDLIHIGTYATAVEAAKAYNDYVIAHNLDRRLNVISGN